MNTRIIYICNYCNHRFEHRAYYFEDPKCPKCKSLDIKEVKEDKDPFGYENKPREMNFIKIPSGSFLMGSPKEEIGRFEDEILHKVTLTNDFEIQETPVTQYQWESMMKDNPSKFKLSPNHPVENVSWNDCQEFIKKLNLIDKRYDYRLPTEAEWEYACRSGSNEAYTSRTDIVDLENYAWFNTNSDERTHPVAKKKPNKYGLYDMHGNVWEWGQDYYGPYSQGDLKDPTGPSSGSPRVLRGGSWRDPARYARSAFRLRAPSAIRDDALGFRLVRINNPCKLFTLKLEGILHENDSM